MHPMLHQELPQNGIKCDQISDILREHTNILLRDISVATENPRLIVPCVVFMSRSAGYWKICWICGELSLWRSTTERGRRCRRCNRQFLCLGVEEADVIMRDGWVVGEGRRCYCELGDHKAHESITLFLFLVTRGLCWSGRRRHADARVV